MPDTIHSDQPFEKSRGRPRSQQKNQAILAAASDIFMEKGFDGTSMDEVARRAGVSKQTVYSHFAGKEALFSASITQVIQEYFPESDFCSEDVAPSLEGELFLICKQFLRLLTSEDAIGMFRILASNATSTEENKLAHLFWEAGPVFMLNRLCDFIDHWVAQGSLSIPNTMEAAHTLISLIKGRHHFQMAIGLILDITEEELTTHAQHCTYAFLKIYQS